MAEWVILNTRIEAARDVRAEPMVEMSSPIHMKEKLRFRKTAKGDVETDEAGAMVIETLLRLNQPVH
jgi:hypothetical protein